MNVEHRIPMSVFRVQMHCECGGIIEPSGLCLTSDPPQHPHKCTHCGASETFKKTYPYIEYKPLDLPVVHLLIDRHGETETVSECPQDSDHGLYSWDSALVTCPECLKASEENADDARYEEMARDGSND